MRELHAAILTSVDGFYEGPGADFRWADVFEDDEFKQYSSETLRAYDTLMFGRKTYDLGTEYWLTDRAVKADESPEVIAAMNDFPKIVFSSTLKETPWGATTIYDGDLIETVKELKSQPGEDILIVGSTSVRSALLNAGLIERLKVWSFPLVLTEGNSLFKGVTNRMTLEVMRVHTFHNGNVHWDYKVPPLAA